MIEDLIDAKISASDEQLLKQVHLIEEFLPDEMFQQFCALINTTYDIAKEFEENQK